MPDPAYLSKRIETSLASGSLTMCTRYLPGTVHVAFGNARVVTHLPADCNNVTGTLACQWVSAAAALYGTSLGRSTTTGGTTASPDAAFSARP